MGRTALARRDAAHKLGAISNRLLRMKRAVLAGKALGDDLCVGVDEDGHERLSAVGGSIRLKRIFAAHGAINLAVVEVFGVEDISAQTLSSGDDLAIPVAQLIPPLHDQR